MKLFSIILTLCLFFILGTGCQNDTELSIQKQIKFNANTKFSSTYKDLVQPNTYLTVEPGAFANQLRSVSKVIAAQDKIFLLDNMTDFHNIWSIDINSGNIQPIGQQGSQPNQYEGLMDATICNGNLLALATQTGAFFEYSLDGKLLNITKNEIFGDHIAGIENGNFIVYNEFNETAKSGSNFLLFYDKAKKLTSKTYSYEPSDIDLAYTYTGFLQKDAQNIWFSPPFANTVYSVKNGTYQPEYVFNFGDKSVPKALAAQNPRGEEIRDYSFLNESFVKTGDFVQFEYQHNSRICHGIYDEITGECADFKQFSANCLMDLAGSGAFVPYDGKQFLLLLQPERLQYLVNKNPQITKDLDSELAGLGTAVKNAATNNRYMLVFMSFRDTARLVAVQN